MDKAFKDLEEKFEIDVVVPELSQRVDNLDAEDEEALISRLMQKDAAEMKAMFPDYDEMEEQLEQFVQELGKKYKTDMYKYVSDLQTQEHQEFSSDSSVLLERIRDTPVGYEILRGACVPYYDWEFLYPTAKDQRKSWASDLNEALGKIRGLFPTGKIYAFDSSGKAGEKFKQSFHFIVRNAGFFEAGDYVPRLKGERGFDDAVYKRAGMRQLFRLPYCSKDGKTRLLKRVDLDNGNRIIDSMDEAFEDLEEKFEDWLVTNVEGETLVIVAEDIPDKKKTDVVRSMDHDAEMTYDKLRDLVMCIETEPGKQDLTRGDWIKVIWAIAYVGHRHGIDYEKIALEFSKKSDTFTGKYLPKVLAKAWTSPPRKPCDVGTLVWFAKKHCPSKLAQWCAKYPKAQMIDPRDPYCWIDFKREKSMKVYPSRAEMLSDVKRDVSRVLVKILQGEGFYIKKDSDYKGDKSLGTVSDISRKIDFELRYVETVEKKTGRGKNATVEQVETETSVMFSKIISHVVGEYGYMDCNPNNTDSKCFNSFMPYQAKPFTGSDRAEKIKPVIDFLHDIICYNDDELFEWLIKWLVILCKYPGVKPEVALVLVSPKEGTGKSTFIRFLSMIIGNYNTVEINSVSEATKDFNMHLYGKRLGVFNEVAETRHEFIHAFQKMKALITDHRLSFEIKGGDKFMAFSSLAWIFVSNNRDCVYMQKGTRRYCAIEVNPGKSQDEEYFNKLNKNIMKQDVADAFLSYLLEKEVTPQQIAGKNIPKTRLQADMINASRPTYEKFLLWAKDRYEYEQTDEFKADPEDLPKFADNIVQADKLFNMYEAWAKANGEKNTVSSTMFGRKINNDSEKLIEKETKRKIAFYDVTKINIE